MADRGVHNWAADVRGLLKECQFNPDLMLLNRKASPVCRDRACHIWCRSGEGFDFSIESEPACRLRTSGESPEGPLPFL